MVIVAPPLARASCSCPAGASILLVPVTYKPLDPTFFTPLEVVNPAGTNLPRTVQSK